MVGKYQNIYEEINLPYAREHNINIVRRMSGGGTIYTDGGGWQFTFISDKAPDTIDFSQYLAPVLSALEALGIDACFTGRNDILIDGKKISGNAQYKLGGKTVHHGSLLFDSDIEQMVKSTCVSNYKIVSKGIKSVRERVTNIAEHMKQPISPEAFKELMVNHIVGENAVKYCLSDEEKQRIQVIADERFHSWDMIYGASPRFSIVKTAHLSGGKVEVHFDVKKGRISDCAIYGDFFSTVSAEEICAALRGCMYDRAAIVNALSSAGLSEAFYNISIDEIAAIMAD